MMVDVWERLSCSIHKFVNLLWKSLEMLWRSSWYVLWKIFNFVQKKGNLQRRKTCKLKLHNPKQWHKLHKCYLCLWSKTIIYLQNTFPPLIINLNTNFQEFRHQDDSPVNRQSSRFKFWKHILQMIRWFSRNWILASLKILKKLMPTNIDETM